VLLEADWRVCADPEAMLAYLEETTDREGPWRRFPTRYFRRADRDWRRLVKRKVRLYACAWFRQAWERLPDARSRLAVEVAEQFADGRATERQRAAARAAAEKAANEALSENWRSKWPSPAECRLAWLASWIAKKNVWQPAFLVSGDTIRSVGVPNRRPAEAALLRDVFGPLPFRDVAVDPAWLTWNDGTVSKLAAGVYDQGRFTDVAILGDALLDAGCTDADLLDHCRQPGSHVRGCWVIDLLAGTG
jgi:hypothetical protein